MNSTYFKSLYQQLEKKSTEATLGVIGMKSEPLRSYLRQLFQNGESLLSDPVFEPTFPWRQGIGTFEDIAGQLISSSLIDALDRENMIKDGDKEIDLKSQALKKHYKPYLHQLEAWNNLRGPDNRSMVVTSGTGSGKTECFMIPVIDDMVRQYEEQMEKLVGVQALFIYPLNALINSQRERLLSWTLPYEENIRFCLYNGNTPKKLKEQVLKNKPKNEVHDRSTLWNSPPPLLITNPTMLEYMLIRHIDSPIIEQSKGKLKYIVLDEAHTYLGSQAAELSLLIRRTLHAFGVKPEEVSFIATSATIGSDKQSENSLKNYLADIAGISPSRINVIKGRRNVPSLPPLSKNSKNTFADLVNTNNGLSTGEIYDNIVAREIREYFIQNSASEPKSLKELKNFLSSKIRGVRESQILSCLDNLSSPNVQSNGTHFLPLRGHFFHRVIHGLWACADKNCKEKGNTPLDSKNWHFGKVYTQQRIKCDCGAPVYELVFCNDCTSEHLYLKREVRGDQLVQDLNENIDEFELEREYSDEESEQEPRRLSERELVIGPHLNEWMELRYINNDGIIGDGGQIAINLNEEDFSCTCCGFRGAGRKKPFRHAYLGMPFYTSNMAPILLEHSSDGKRDPLSSPFRGKSMITFTDSRQGTARIAIKMQQDAERMRVRALVFKSLYDFRNSQEIRELNVKINELKDRLKTGGSDPLIESILKEKENELSNKEVLAVSWNDLKNRLKDYPDVSKHIKAYYQSLNPTLFGGEYGIDKVLQCILISNFGRRPRRANSLETLGFIKVGYSGLDKVNTVPSSWSQQNLTLKNWKDFLKIILDYFVRDGVFLNIDHNLLNWLGGRFTPKLLLSPRSNESPDRRHRPWPQYNIRGRQHRMVRILCESLEINLSEISNGEIDLINELLLSAWDDLTSISGLLTKFDNGYKLALEKFVFQIPEERWLCPVTQRVLDTTLNCLTPYLPYNAQSGSYNAKLLDFPEIPSFQDEDYETNLNNIREWLENDEKVVQLKRIGVWTNQSDQIVEGSAFFRVAEHSAQISANRLQKYENDFKEGRINILSCSTTMEMGVDIGGLTMIANNNVPPHPSNYLQRAGRAGRRNESRALSITLCKNNPLDLKVFDNPKWAFTTKLKEPNVTLTSERIIQRHINAFLFGYFIKNRLPEQNYDVKYQASWFFVKMEAQEISICQIMLAWMKEQKDNLDNVDLLNGIEIIREKSVLQKREFSQIITSSFDKLSDIYQDWIMEYQFFSDELERLEQEKVDENDPYYRKLHRDIDRHANEYLISELVKGGFLPGYGFPTDIATFNPYSVDNYLRNNRDMDNSREDNLSIYRQKPSRNLSMALAEYAPGAEVVLDGKVYKSKGITLNWHIPDSSVDITETQEMGIAWRCRNCGKMGIAKGINDARKCTSPACHSTNLERHKYIKPQGFSVDFFSAPSNDITHQNFIPIQEPWIHAGNELKNFPDQSLGSYRAGEDGTVFHYSAGVNGTGYAVCMSCGRSESLTLDRTLPEGFLDHNRLRGKPRGQSKKCNPTENMIQSGVVLGFADSTDILELFLKESSTGRFLEVNDDNNRILSYSLGVALRDGLAQSLGVNSDEIGIAVKQSTLRNVNYPVYSICLFDTSSGGSGFSSQAPMHFKDMFSNALRILDCNAECDSACEKCLLNYDTRKLVQYLNRHLAKEYLENGVIDKLEIPSEEKILGEDSEYCIHSQFEELEMADKGSTSKLEFFVSKDTSSWGIGTSKLKRIINEIGNIDTCIYIPSEAFKKLDEDHKLDLLALMSSCPNCSFISWQNYPAIEDGNLMSILRNDNQRLSFATRRNGATEFNEEWGEVQEGILLKSKSFDYLPVGSEITRRDLLPESNSNMNQVEVVKELNGAISNFGFRFWKVIEDNSKEFLKEYEKLGISRISYSDRFLASPLTAILFSKLVESLPFCFSSEFKIVLKTMEPNGSSYFPPYREIYHNWQPSEKNVKATFLRRLMENAQSKAKVDILLESDRKKLSHARELKLYFENNKLLIIRLDQGVGYWKVENKNVNYAFENSIDDQLQWIKENSEGLSIANNQNHPTIFYLKKDNWNSKFNKK